MIIQYSKPVYSRGLLRTIDALSALHGERVEVRFFGHYSDRFDFASLRDLPAVKALAVDCLQEALNVDVLWTGCEPNASAVAVVDEAVRLAAAPASPGWPG